MGHFRQRGRCAELVPVSRRNKTSLAVRDVVAIASQAARLMPCPPSLIAFHQLAHERNKRPHRSGREPGRVICGPRTETECQVQVPILWFICACAKEKENNY